MKYSFLAFALVFVAGMALPHTGAAQLDKNLINDFRFIMRVPDGWEYQYDSTMARGDQNGVPTVIALAPREGEDDDFQENINLIVQKLPDSTMTLEEYVAVSKQGLSQYLQDFEMDSSVVALNMDDELYASLIFSGKASNLVLKFWQYYFLYRGKAYVLTFTSERNTFGIYEEQAKACLDSFHIKLLPEGQH